jgi:hypothetical protein
MPAIPRVTLVRDSLEERYTLTCFMIAILADHFSVNAASLFSANGLVPRRGVNCNEEHINLWGWVLLGIGVLLALVIAWQNFCCCVRAEGKESRSD